MHARELHQLMTAKKAPAVIDVRSGIEFRNGHIPGAIHAPALKILLRTAPLPTGKEELLVVTCEHGPRAQLAQAILGWLGYRNTVLLDGHMSNWRREQLPLEK